MYRANFVIRAFSDISPHLKAINSLGINSRSIVFNPRYKSFYSVSLSFMK